MAAELPGQQPVSPVEIADSPGNPRVPLSAPCSGSINCSVPAASFGVDVQPPEYRDNGSRTSAPLTGPADNDNIEVTTSTQRSHRNSAQPLIPPPNQPPIEPQIDIRLTPLRIPWWKRPYISWGNPKRRHWCFIFVPLSTCLLVVVIVVVILWRVGDKHISITLNNLAQITVEQSKALPRSNSALGATQVRLGAFATSASSSNETMVAYTDELGYLCIKKKSAVSLSWPGNVQCITDAKPKPKSPISFLDWIGGPSVYFVDTTEHLSGIDFVPQNSSWALSKITKEKKTVHKDSQLAAITWFNGTSSWIYFQNPSGQICEFGIVDYRDSSYRDGAIGPLGLAAAGSSIGAARWLSGSSEVLEIFYQAISGSIYGRVYRAGVWQPDFYSVAGSSATQGGSMTATTVTQEDDSQILIAYVDDGNFLAVQSRGTTNVTSVYSEFSRPQRLVEGNGNVAAVGSSGLPKVYFGVSKKILELSGSDVSAINWTTVDVTTV